MGNKSIRTPKAPPPPPKAGVAVEPKAGVEPAPNAGADAAPKAGCIKHTQQSAHSCTRSGANAAEHGALCGNN